MNIFITSGQDSPVFGLNIYLLACLEMNYKNDSTKVREKTFKTTVLQQYTCRVRTMHFEKRFAFLVNLHVSFSSTYFFPNKLF